MRECVRAYRLSFFIFCRARCSLALRRRHGDGGPGSGAINWFTFWTGIRVHPRPFLNWDHVQVRHLGPCHGQVFSLRFSRRSLESDVLPGGGAEETQLVSGR